MSGFATNALEAHRAGAGPVPLSPARMPGLHSPARGGPDAPYKTRPRPHRRLPISMTTAAPTASGARVSGMRTAPREGPPGPGSAASQRPRPPTWPARPAAPTPGCPVVDRPGRAPGPRSCSAAAESPSRGFRPGSRRWSSGSGRQPAANAAARTRHGRRCSGSRGHAAPPRPAPPLAAHAPRRARPESGSGSCSWAPARPAVAGCGTCGGPGPAHLRDQV